MMKPIAVSVDAETGYTLYKIGEENVLACQKVDGAWHIIPKERPAQTLDSPDQVSKVILTVLHHEGGDVQEFCCREQNPFQLPL